MSEKQIQQEQTSEDLQQIPSDQPGTVVDDHGPQRGKRPWWHGIKEPGHALQIVVAALLAIGIGMAVTNTVDDVPEAASAIIAIPGTLWLRSLRAVGMD